MIDWLAPSLTKKVPMMEAMMQMPPIDSGSIIIFKSASAPAVR